jgi:O-antigen/teichoic acid export membrane protein
MTGDKSKHMSGDLTRSVVRGAGWTGISQIMQQGFHLLAMIVLARLLLPDDFGIASMAIIFTSIAVAVFDLGLNQAIIQRKEITESHLSTTFWLVLFMGVIFCIVIVFASPWVAKFFNNDAVGPVLAVASISCVICPLGSVHGALLRKKLDFFRFSVAEATAAVVYLATAVSMAFAGFGVWSIVAGGLANDATYVTMRWILYRWHPSFTFSISSLKDLWSFGMNQTGTKLIEIIDQRMDYLIIGRFLSAASLGFYNLGLRVTHMPSQYLRFIITRVAFPAFSTIQDENTRLRRGFLKGVAYISIIGLPLFVGLVIVAPEFVRVIFGQKWELAILPMQILCAAAVFRVLGLAVPSLMLSKGRPDILLKISLTRLVLLVGAFLVGVRYGTVGVAIALSSVEAVIWPIQQILANRIMDLRMKDYMISVYPAVLGCAVMAVILIGFRYTITSMFTLPDIALLVSAVALGIIAYFATLKLTKIESFNEMLGLFQELVKPFFRPAMVKIGIVKEDRHNDIE